MIQLMLLMRQNMASNGHSGINLSDKEAIDKMDWKSLVKQNHMLWLKNDNK